MRMKLETTFILFSLLVQVCPVGASALWSVRRSAHESTVSTRDYRQAAKVHGETLGLESANQWGSMPRGVRDGEPDDCGDAIERLRDRVPRRSELSGSSVCCCSIGQVAHRLQALPDGFDGYEDGLLGAVGL